MQVLHRVPKEPLSRFVELLWLFDGYAPGHAQERLLPMGTAELVIDLKLPRVAPLISGPTSESFVLDTAGAASVVGVHFKPGGVFAFFDLPAGELHNQHVALDVLWGARASELRDRILEAPTAESKLAVLERLLIREARTFERHRAVGYALAELQRPEAVSVAGVTETIGLSQRRFIECFKDEVGLTPKLFHRVQRFQAVVRRVHRATEVDWTEVALECGYYDQAHFIHDFRTFSGFSPSKYFAQKSEHQNHVPLD